MTNGSKLEETGPEGPVFSCSSAAARTAAIITAIAEAVIIAAEARNEQNPDQPFAAVISA